MHGRQGVAGPDGVGWGAAARRTLRGAVVLAAGLALLAPGMAERAGADRKYDASGAGTANVQVCEAAGGEADVTQFQNGAGDQMVDVKCNGGYLDGWHCTHDNQYGTWQCHTDRVVPGGGWEAAPIGELGAVVAAFQTGSPKQIDAAVAVALEAEDAAGAGAPEGDQVQDHHVGKHGKHGKHGGKGRPGGKHPAH